MNRTFSKEAIQRPKAHETVLTVIGHEGDKDENCWQADAKHWGWEDRAHLPLLGMGTGSRSASQWGPFPSVKRSVGVPLSRDSPCRLYPTETGTRVPTETRARTFAAAVFLGARS